jgi:hypothetical protein
MNTASKNLPATRTNCSALSQPANTAAATHLAKRNERRTWIVLPALLVAALMTQSASALVVTQPTSLLPGDQYRLAFVTSTTTPATDTDIGFYNNFVDLLGDANVIASDWRAMASTSAIHANVNTGSFVGAPVDVPIFLLNDTKLVDGNGDLWDDTLDTSLKITDLGNTISDEEIWTGTSSVGLSGCTFTCALGSLQPLFGLAHSVDGKWTNTGLFGNPDDSNRLYAMSGVLTAVPESLCSRSNRSWPTGAAGMRTTKEAAGIPLDAPASTDMASQSPFYRQLNSLRI